MREGGKILAEILKKLSEAVRPGITTLDLDRLARELVLFYKVKPEFLGYAPHFFPPGGFPGVICTSVNEGVVHYAPAPDKILNEGDIINLDAGIKYKDFCLDSAITVPVTNLSYEEWAKQSSKLRKLLEVTKESLNIGIKQAKVGNYIGDIGHAVQVVVERNGFSVIRELVGHGIGHHLHEEPQVPNFGFPGEGERLQEGMVVAIEPMVSMGGWQVVKESKRGFGYRTRDGSWVAHFEHTVAVTKNGPLVLTKS